MPDPTDALRSQLRAANEALRVLREAVQACEPFHMRDGDCVGCGRYGDDASAMEPHLPTCPVVALRAALSAPEPEPRCGYMTCHLPSGHDGQHEAWSRVVFGPAYETTVDVSREPEPQSVEAPAPAAPPQLEAPTCTCPDAGLPMLGHSPDCPIGLAEARLRRAPPADRAEPKRDACLGPPWCQRMGVNARHCLQCPLSPAHAAPPAPAEPRMDTSEPGSAAAPDAEKRDVSAAEVIRELRAVLVHMADASDDDHEFNAVMDLSDAWLARWGAAAERDGKDGGR